MGFGLSFGSKKTSSKGTATIDKTETGTQSGSESTTGSTTTSGSSNTQSGSTGTSSTAQNQNQQSNTQSSTTSTTSQNSFSDALAGGIENSISTLLGGIGSTQDAVNNSIAKLSGFNAGQFVQDSVAAAQSKVQSGLDESLGGLFDAIGGNPGQNSMSALLANRLTGDAAATIAGVRGQAEQTAAQILQQNAATTADAAGGIAGLAPALIGAFKGGNVTGQQTNLAQEIANLVGASTGQTNTAEQSTQNTQTTQVQNMIQAILQNLNTTTNTKGTETQNTKGKESGFGFSLSG